MSGKRLARKLPLRGQWVSGEPLFVEGPRGHSGARQRPPLAQKAWVSRGSGPSTGSPSPLCLPPKAPGSGGRRPGPLRVLAPWGGGCSPGRQEPPSWASPHPCIPCQVLAEQLVGKDRSPFIVLSGCFQKEFNPGGQKRKAFIPSLTTERKQEEAVD